MLIAVKRFGMTNWNLPADYVEAVWPLEAAGRRRGRFRLYEIADADLRFLLRFKVQETEAVAGGTWALFVWEDLKSMLAAA